MVSSRLQPRRQVHANHAAVPTRLAWTILVAALAACGTGGEKPPPPPPPPTCLTPPADQLVATGTTATFSVVAGGAAPITYQWRRDGSAVAGATLASYTTPPTALSDSGARFTVALANAGGSTTCPAATLTVLEPPVITADPVSATVTAPDPASFAVTASGSPPLTYAWLYDGAPLPGATSSSLVFSPTAASEDGATLQAVVTNPVGTATSAVATLTVRTGTTQPPVIVPQPVSLHVLDGAAATFTSGATGAPPIAFQWLKDGVAIPGATGASHTTPAATYPAAVASYTLAATNPGGTTISSVATLTVDPRPIVIAQQPQSLTVQVGSTATFAVFATGSPVITYQWRRNGTAIPGAIAATYTTPVTTAADTGASFSVVLTNPASSVTSAAAVLTVVDVPVKPTIVPQPASLSVLDGATATFTSGASGTAPITFQWFKDGVAIPGATGTSHTTPPAAYPAAAASYTMVATNAAGSTPSNAATLTVAPRPITITRQPAGLTVTEGLTATFSVATTGTAPITSQWLKSGTPIPGATAATFTTPPAPFSDNQATYAVILTNPAGSVTSATVTLTVLLLPPVIAVPPIGLIVDEGQPATFSVTATSGVPPTYQWRRGGTNVQGAQSSTFTLAAAAPADDLTSYDVVVTNPAGSATSAPPVQLRVRYAPRITTQPADVFGALGQPASFTVAAAGNPAPTYQWRRGGVDVPGATAATFTLTSVANADDGAVFTVAVSNALGTVVSQAATLHINHAPAPTAPAIDTFELAAGTSQVAPNDPDAGQAHAYAVTTPPAHGVATVSAAGLVTYTPAAGFTGIDQLAVTVTDDGQPPLSGAVTIPVTVRAALALMVTATPDPIAPNLNALSQGLVQYELKVANLGATALTGLVLKDTVPNAATALLLASTGAPACGGPISCAAGTTVTWPALTLPAGQVATFLLTVQVTAGSAAGTVVHDVATLTSAGGTLTQALDVTVGTQTGLALGIAEDHDPVRPGELLGFTLVIGNSAAAALPAGGLGVVTATVPPGTTFVAATAGGAFSNGVVTWPLGFVDPGGDQRLGYTVAVDAALPDATVLLARAAVLDAGQVQARAATATDVKAVSPIRLTVSVDPDPVAPDLNGLVDGLVHYQLRVSNLGATPVAGVVPRAVFRDDATVLILATTGGAACGGSIACGPGGPVTWPAVTLAAGQTEVLTMTVQALAGTPDGTLVQGRFEASYPGGAASLRHDLVARSGPGLRLGLSADRDPVRPGDPLTYTVVVSNTAAAALPASGLGELRATLPSGTTFVSAIRGGTAGGGVVSWNLAFVDPGDDQRFTFTVAPDPALVDGTVLQSRAEVLDGQASLVRTARATGVKAASPIELTVSVDPDPVAPDQSGLVAGLVHYELKVANRGATPISSVVLSEVLRNDATVLILATTGGAACGGSISCGPGVFATWPAVTLAGGQVTTFRMTAKVAAGTPPGTLVHGTFAAAFPGGLVRQDHELVARGGAGLRLEVSGDHDPVLPGDRLTYTVALGNTAAAALPASTQGVLTATIPPGTTFTAATGGGTTAGGKVTWNLGFVNPGDVRRFSYTVTVDPALPAGAVLPARAEVLDGAASLVRAALATDVRAASPIRLTVHANPDPAAPNLTAFENGLVHYELRVANLGATALSSVVVSGVLREDATVLILSTTGGAACGGSIGCGPGTIVTWPPLTIPAGQSVPLTMTAQVAAGAPDGTLIHGTFGATFTGGAAAQAHDLTVRAGAGLRLALEEDQDAVKPGALLTYSVVVGNTAAAALPAGGQGVLNATIPPGTTFASASAGGTAAGGVVTWPLGSVAPHTGQVFTYAVTVGAGVANGTLLPARAEVSDGGASLVRAAAATQVQAASAVTLGVTAVQTAVNQVTYTLTATNAGPTTLAGVVLQDVVRDDATALLLSSTGSPACGGSISCPPGAFVTWPAVTLAAGASTTVTLVSQTTAGTPAGTLLQGRAFAAWTGGEASQGTVALVP